MIRAANRVYDIEIVNQQQKTVALFRGKSHRIGGAVAGRPDA